LIDNYPFSYRDSYGRPTGFAFELLQILEPICALRFDRIYGSPSEINPRFENGDLRMLQSFSPSQQRQTWAEFSMPYLSMTGRMFAIPGHNQLKTYEDMAGLRVAVHPGSIGEQFLEEQVPNAEIVLVPSILEAFQAVQRGDADATLAANLTGQATLAYYGFDLKVVGDPIEAYKINYCFAVNHNDSELLIKLNEGLAVIIETGDYDALYQKWFGAYDKTRFSETDILIAISIGLDIALVGSVLAWYRGRRLRRRLQKLNKSLEEEIEHREQAKRETEILNKELQILAIQAQSADRAKSEFLARISHEIRTPMNAIIGMNNILLDTPMTQTQQEYAEIVRDGAEGLLSIFNDILDLSVIETGRLTLIDEVFDLRKLIDNTLDMVSIQAEEKQLELGAIILHEMPTQWQGDPGRLRQVLLNLLGNAVKFTEQGHIHLYVTFNSSIDSASVQETGKRSLRFEIRDTGEKIPEESITHIFEPFVQGDGSSTRRHGGIGLGLAICRQIIETVGGSIGVEPISSGGNCFWFHFPLGIVNSFTSEQPTPLPRTLLFRANTPTTKMLLRHYAERLKISLFEVKSDAEIVDKFSEYQPIGIFREISFRNGYREILELMRMMPNLPLIFILPKTLTVPSEIENPSISSIRKPLRFEDFNTVCKYVCAGDVHSFPDEVQSGGEHTAIFGSLNVLVVEDNKLNCRIIDLLLQKFGIRARFADNGLMGLQCVAEETPDLILMDCQMPHLDGLETTRQLRENYKGLFIAAMTANTMKGDREKCLAVGMDGFLAKPVREEALHQILRMARNKGKN